MGTPCNGWTGRMTSLNKDIEDKLWNELRLLQPIIDKIDTISVQIKNWFITTFAALTGISITSNKPELLLINLILIVAFYCSESANRLAHEAFLSRTRRIQEILREGKTVKDSDLPPNLDQDLLHGLKEWQALGKLMVSMLGQPRVSLVYWLAALITGIMITLQ